MGIKSIKSGQSYQQPITNRSFSYKEMIGFKINTNVEEFYEIFEQIGSGAEGQVFKAKCKKTGNYRAIKKINKLNNQRGFQSICNQYNILKQLDHPSILKIYQIYDFEDTVFMVSELCEGKELFQLIVDDKIIGEEKCFPIFYELLNTINFLHQNNIMHRDIKPENIMVSENLTEIKLIDLGTAIKFDGTQVVKRKRIGTSYYIAPQVLSRQYNYKCDIWSLGVILFILLSGSLPFQGAEDIDVLRAVEKGNVEYPHSKWKHISTLAKETVKSMLQRDISNRPSAQELMNSQWIKQNSIKIKKQLISNDKIINSHLSNMRNFKELTSSPIQDGIFIFIVNFVQNTKTGQRQFLQTFRALDVNRDGVISEQELRIGLERFLKLPREECQTISRKIFEKVDVNNSGSIDYSEFVMSASNVEIVVTEENIDMAFSFMDVDNSGKLSVKEIREKLGQSVSEEQYNNLLKKFDKNSDGEISRYEFRDMMKALVKKNKPSASLQRKGSLCKPLGGKGAIESKLVKRSSMNKPLKK